MRLETIFWLYMQLVWSELKDPGIPLEGDSVILDMTSMQTRIFGKNAFIYAAQKIEIFTTMIYTAI